MKTNILLFLLILSVIFVIYTNYKKIEIGAKVEEKEIELGKNIKTRLQEHFSNFPKINFTENTNFYKSTNYLPTMSPINLKARGFESVNHAIQKCVNGFQKISKDDEVKTQQLIFTLLENSSVKSKKFNKYLQYWIPKIKIAKQKNWLESGMPHTHTNIIILNPSWFINPRKSTFIHELTHVHQRLKPDDFKDLFKNWGFIYYSKGIHTIKGLEDKPIISRHNPDGLDLNWIWKTPNLNYYWISAQFIRSDNITLTDVEYIAYQLEHDGNGNYFYLNKIPIQIKTWNEFQRYFKINNNHYHPNEIAAQYAEYYQDDQLSNTESNYGKGYQIYFNHMNNLLQSL